MNKSVGRDDFQDAFRESEDRFRDLVEGSIEGILIHRNFKALFVNRAYANIFGFDSPEQVMALDSVLELAMPHEQALAKRNAAARLRGNDAPTAYEYEGLRKDGSTIWLDNRVRVISWQREPAIQSTVVDITERKRTAEALRDAHDTLELRVRERTADLEIKIAERKHAEEALSQSEERFRFAFENAPVGMALITPEGTRFKVNNALADFLGYTVEELADTDMKSTAADLGDLDESLRLRQQVLDGEIETYRNERRYRHKKGHIVWGEVSGSLFRNENGEPEHFIASTVDITERKNAEEALRESEARLAKAAELAKIGHWIWDEVENQALYCSEEMAKIFGVASGADLTAMLSSHAATLEWMHPEDRERFDLMIHTTKDSKRGDDSEYRIIDAAGEVRHLHIIAAPVLNARGEIIRSNGIVQDITDRKRAEETLRDSEDRFKDFAESASDWFWEMDEDLRFTYMSPTVERVVGVPPEWHYGKTREDILDKDYDREVWNQHLQILKAHQPFREFIYLRTGEGVDPKWLASSGKPVFDADGKFRGYRGSGRDITERKRAEEALRESEDRFKYFAESASDWFWETDESLRFTYVSPTVERVFGMAPEWYYGKTRKDLLSENYDRDVWEQHLQTLEAHQPFREFTYSRIVEGANPKWVTGSGKPVFDADGEYRGYRGSGRDITELKEREIALRDSEETLREILEKSPIGVAIVMHASDHGRATAKRLFANDALVKILGGTSREGMLESDISKTWVDLDQYHVVNETMTTGGDLVDFEARRRRDDGVEFWVSMNTRPIRFDNQDCTMVWHFDVTERKRSEDQIKASLEEKEVLLSEIHHRVKNNLQVISGMLWLQANADKNTHTVEVLRDSHRRVMLMAHIHESLYRQDDLNVISASDLLDNLVADTMASSGGISEHLSFQVDVDDIPLDVDHANAYGQIVSELIFNSMKHAFATGQPGNVEVSLHRRPGGVVELTVADDGKGLPKDFDLGQAKTLGLRLVGSLAAKLGGQIEIDGSGGTRVQIKFPEKRPT